MRLSLTAFPDQGISFPNQIFVLCLREICSTGLRLSRFAFLTRLKFTLGKQWTFSRQMEPSLKPKAKGGVIHCGVGASYTRMNPTRRMCHLRRNLVKDFPILKKERTQPTRQFRRVSRLLKEIRNTIIKRSGKEMYRFDYFQGLLKSLNSSS